MNICPNCGCDPTKEPYVMEPTHCPVCGYAFEKTYKIIYTETLVHWFYVDAKNEVEAKEKFEQGLMDGEFDFTHGDVDSSDFKIEEDG
jgi:hypothetical protein